MTKEQRDRLAHAVKAADALKATLAPPKQKRTERVLVVFTPDEKARLDSLAGERGEAAATTARNLIMAALEALGK